MDTRQRWIKGALCESQDEVFVTRSPCLDPSDGSFSRSYSANVNFRLGFLEQLCHFGHIVFPTPKRNSLPLPTLFADGDLEGDLYFVLWDEEILTKLQEREELRIIEVPPKGSIEKESKIKP